MILYTLCCDNGHEFEVWFRDSAAYEVQAEAGIIGCPQCGSVRVSKAIMAPNIRRHHAVRRDEGGVSAETDSAASPTTGTAAPDPAATAAPSSKGTSDGGGVEEASAPPERATVRARPTPEVAAKLAQALEALRVHVEATCDDVGDNFAEEARRIHYGESEARGIYGDTTADEADALREEGVAFATIPWRRRRTDG